MTTELATEDSHPWRNPKPPNQPKTWIERKKELDCTIWADVRMLATLGHKKFPPEVGNNTGLLPYHQVITMHRDEVKKTILEHELKLGWVLPPEPIQQVTNELMGQPMANTLTTPIIVDFPNDQPQPPPIQTRRRRSSSQVAPPFQPTELIVGSPTVEAPGDTPNMNSQQLSITPLLSGGNSSSAGNSSELAEFRRQLSENRAALANLQQSTDKIGKMLEGIAGELEKKLLLVLTAMHHTYMANPNVLSLLQQVQVDPATIRTLSDFLMILARFAGIQYP